MTITTARLVLTPLAPADADEMVGVLADPLLYQHMGGQPPALDELRARYQRLVAGAHDPHEQWLNWIVRVQGSRQAVGTVQATVRGDHASVAWIVGTAWQGRGLASEAACALVAWLEHEGITHITANIHRDHVASQKVAARAGLSRTDRERDGEEVWMCRPAI
jgi:RimJ/RimL family protein N-acetyltransferase